MKQVIAVVGPTASGKSAFSVALAKLCGAEIISADSMQIYKGLDIGTAKIRPQEMHGVPHHLIDIVEPTDSFSVQQYQARAEGVMDTLRKHNTLPIIAGGTGLYVQSLLYSLDFFEASPNPSLRKELEEKSDDALYRLLAKRDPKRAANIHPNNRRRIIRALEILAAGKRPENNGFRTKREDLSAKIYGLIVERDLLHRRIETRVDQMLEDGLIEECRAQLFPNGLHTQAASAIGYAETLAYLRGLCTKKELRNNIIVHTRQYAKRQMTWFRRMDVEWIPHTTDPEVIARRFYE